MPNNKALKLYNPALVLVKLNCMILAILTAATTDINPAKPAKGLKKLMMIKRHENILFLEKNRIE